MDADGFSTPEERKAFETLADKFIDLAYEAKIRGKGRRWTLFTEGFMWNGYHEITMNRWDIEHAGGKKNLRYVDDNRLLAIKLRKMVLGK